MKKLRAWFATPGGRQFFNIIYSLGAAVVIIGALFKIIHVPIGDTIFIVGMSIEAFIFFLSAFDTSYTDSSPATGAGGGYVINTNDAIQSHPTASSISGTSDKKVAQSSGSGGSSVIVVGGGSSTETAGSGSVAASTGGANVHVSGGTTSGGVSGGGTSSNISGGSSTRGASAGATGSAVTGGNINIPTQEYAQSAADATQNLEDFSQTMKSLNETSQTILHAYKEIAESQNLGETMNTLRYINDSLARIKGLYDGAIGDSYMFKEEMSKMTRHIEALNQVYARLLQAMTMNNPNNNNNFPHNPPY